jgi:hypothetical protein
MVIVMAKTPADGSLGAGQKQQRPLRERAWFQYRRRSRGLATPVVVAVPDQRLSQ